MFCKKIAVPNFHLGFSPHYKLSLYKGTSMNPKFLRASLTKSPSRFAASDTSKDFAVLNELANVLKDIKDVKSDANTTQTAQIPKKAMYTNKKSDDPNSLMNLKYLHIYPKKIRQWILDAKTPKGRFDSKGEWITVADTGDSTVSKIVASAVARRALKEEPNTESKLPPDLQGAYRFGVTEEQIKECHPKIKELLSFTRANQHEVHQFRLGKLVQKFGREQGDTGSSKVQVACMTERVNYLTEHMRKHPHDKHTQYRVNLLISKRRKMMKYLKRTDVAGYYHVLKEMGVKDIIP